MFTGIVQGTATVRNATIDDGILRLDLDLPNTDGLVPGASVSISGVCLTAVDIAPPTVRFDVIAESLDRTTLGDLRPGSRVNVERAARFGDEIGGHVTSGHIWGCLLYTSPSPRDRTRSRMPTSSSNNTNIYGMDLV